MWVKFDWVFCGSDAGLQVCPESDRLWRASSSLQRRGEMSKNNHYKRQILCWWSHFCGSTNMLLASSASNRPLMLLSLQMIDGEAFLLLTQTDIVKIMSIKLGPALKISNAILMFKTTDEGLKWSHPLLAVEEQRCQSSCAKFILLQGKLPEYFFMCLVSRAHQREGGGNGVQSGKKIMLWIEKKLLKEGKNMVMGVVFEKNWWNGFPWWCLMFLKTLKHQRQAFYSCGTSPVCGMLGQNPKHIFRHMSGSWIQAESWW